jgi:hypothetical protein
LVHDTSADVAAATAAVIADGDVLYRQWSVLLNLHDVHFVATTTAIFRVT